MPRIGIESLQRWKGKIVQCFQMIPPKLVHIGTAIVVQAQTPPVSITNVRRTYCVETCWPALQSIANENGT